MAFLCISEQRAEDLGHFFASRGETLDGVKEMILPRPRRNAVCELALLALVD